MATKRKIPKDFDEDHQQMHVSNKKHTLDSDEDDSDEYEKDDIHESDIEGEEEGVATVQDEIKLTPFNMREELQEGHFDKEGQYHWDKNSEIKDNWLDNIDWVKVQNDKTYLNPADKKKKKGAADSSDDDDDAAGAKGLLNVFNPAQSYAKVLEYMQPQETVQKTLQRLGKSRVKLSSAERLRRKKQGIVDEAGERITKFTELANEILTRTGNMDIYQETYAQIKSKAGSNGPSTSKQAQNAKAAAEEFDMYADDFEDKEKKRLETAKQSEENGGAQQEEVANKRELMWEFKWKQDDAELHGPYTTEQMLKWTQEDYFKGGVYVRKVGETNNFYTSNRIDFDLYL